MPEESDKYKGPLELITMSKSFAKGDYEKGSLSLVNTVGFAAFAYGRYMTKNAAAKQSFGIEMKWLWRAIIFIMFLQQLLGGASDSGQKYKTAKKDFQLAEKSFEAAVAEADGWSGAAAEAYNEQNDLQRKRANKMAETDGEISKILKTEAEQVKRTSLDLSWEQASLVILIPICHALNASTNPAAKAASQIIQKGAFIGAVGAGIGIISAMAHDASENRDHIEDWMYYYRQQAESAEASLQVLLGDTAAAGAVSTEKSTVSTFDALSNQFDAANSPPDAANDQLGAANDVGAPDAPVATSPNEPSTAGAVSAEKTAAEGDSGAASVGDPLGAVVPPAFTVPTMSDVASRASQASTTPAAQAAKKAAPYIPDAVGAVRDTVGVVDQINSMVQPAAATDPAATATTVPAEEAVLAEDANPANAAAGAESGERVPVDVAAGGTEQGQQPSPTERIV